MSNQDIIDAISWAIRHNTPNMSETELFFLNYNSFFNLYKINNLIIKCLMKKKFYKNNLDF